MTEGVVGQLEAVDVTHHYADREVLPDEKGLLDFFHVVSIIQSRQGVVKGQFLHLFDRVDLVGDVHPYGQEFLDIPELVPYWRIDPS